MATHIELANKFAQAVSQVPHLVPGSASITETGDGSGLSVGYGVQLLTGGIQFNRLVSLTYQEIEATNPGHKRLETIGGRRHRCLWGP